MDNEMIERCSAALVKATQELKTNDNSAEIVVVAVIKAMREPTKDMVDAALHDYIYREKNKQPWNGRAMYEAMIDAIIGGK